ncbi:YbaK/aminoacyl-tRNA synthetase-associated domain [Arabidopsis suecica]|uniref:YbaK/aminoacyl-tRNA synthetase-associated domain n=1 Tax=Arabidopsis suecica TaxID=45249 RepID=A0A8T1YM55_ARASU|nr:YbaK/aminoacyl-tRNA synthetase-associated domain [Arabidopsis suecica]
MEDGEGMEAAAAELERLQIEILHRISVLESTFLPQSSSAAPSPSLPVDENETVTRLSTILRSGGVKDFCFKRVAPDYYDWPLESRRNALDASSVDHLCKSIVLVNTQASSNILDCSDRNNSKYYVVVVQYTARFNAEAVKQFLYTLNEGKIPKKRFNLRLAPEETSIKLTAFEHNAVTCIGMKTNIPVILDEAITKLKPDFFWLGGGEIDLKLGVRTSEFLEFVKPFIVPCS